MKINKKIISIVLIIICVVSTSANATFSINQANLYSKGICQTLLKDNEKGGEIIVTKVFYRNGEKEYPAYCMNLELGGVGEYGSYDVTINESVENPLVWRAVINGYPYQSLETLGVANEDEAYTATKQAIYCILYNYDENTKYEPIGEAGVRTLNAIKQIVSKAKNSTEVKQSNKIKIEKQSELKIDEKDSNYVIQNFKIIAECNIIDYNVKINGEKEQQINIEKLSLNEFRVIFPVKLLENDISFEMSIEGKLETKPVLYGIPYKLEYQTYALAGEIYEIGEEKINVEYSKNNSKVIIVKNGEDENSRLQGVKFQILNENNEIIYKDLVTNQNGEIEIKGIMPGRYYLEEVETIEGYKKRNDKIEFNIGLNDEIKLLIKNEKQKIVEVPEEKIKKLPVTGM